ncbi:uncharacterized protein LODBEIA_P27460 [Lodderomyces beijingensis]|uniref:N-acetylglucosamine-induced protein 1 n=1 Tax=Lodderomyces beijingensis TaxID=1775926 RepID=A0ABP0ZQN9_9ASCO
MSVDCTTDSAARNLSTSTSTAATTAKPTLISTSTSTTASASPPLISTDCSSHKKAKDQLQTPPASPAISDKLASIYHHFDIQIYQSSLMPQPSKIKHSKPFTWDDVVYIVSSNQLEIFARSQAQTDDYHDFKQQLKDQNININDYILRHELHWQQSDIRSQRHVVAPQQYSLSYPDDLIFYNEQDVKILPNKFPYYFDKNIVHLCIWSKLTIPNDTTSAVGDVSPLTRRIINKYLAKTFVEHGVQPAQIVWFRNWTSLQSVRSISHIHVILHDVDPVFIQQLIGTGGTPLTREDYKKILDQ